MPNADFLRTSEQLLAVPLGLARRQLLGVGQRLLGIELALRSGLGGRLHQDQRDD